MQNPPLKVVLGIFLAVVLLQIPAEFIIAGFSVAWGILINEALFILAVPLAILKLMGFGISSILPLGRPGKRQVLVAACMTLGAAVVISYVRSASDHLIPLPEAFVARQTRAMAVRSWNDFFPKLLLLGMIAPFCEEILFRGIIQPALARRTGSAISIVITAVFFALIHSTSFQPHLYLLLGLLFSWLFAVTGSLRITIMCHAINNSWALANQVRGLGFPIEGSMRAADWTLLASGALIVLAGAILMMRFKRETARGRSGA
ncbi:MAG: type II CAAX endopeptidase family protein [Pseudomonadota bacterium]